MISDEMLHDAATKAHDALVYALPETVDEYQFSKRLERKMQRLLRRAKYRTVYYALNVACLFLVIVLSYTMFLTVNVNARGFL